MKKILTAFSAFVLLVSCQKEVGFDDGNNTGNNGGNGGNGNGNTSGLLVKAVAVTGAETITTTYTYDSQKRLETMIVKGTSGGMVMDSYHKYFRDAAGRIVQVKQKLADMPPATTDTAVITYHYPDATTMNYDYSVHVMTMDIGGMSMSTIDSAVYTYTSAKLMSYSSFMSSSMMPGMIMSRSRTDFAYDASDKVTGMKTYNDGGNQGAPLTLIADYKYTYAATTVNNVYMAASGAQNFALNGLPNTTASIITKMEMVSDATAPPMTVITTTTYVTGAGNKPVSGTVVATTTGQPTQTTNYTFFYQ